MEWGERPLRTSGSLRGNLPPRGQGVSSSSERLLERDLVPGIPSPPVHRGGGQQRTIEDRRGRRVRDRHSSSARRERLDTGVTSLVASNIWSKLFGISHSWTGVEAKDVSKSGFDAVLGANRLGTQTNHERAHFRSSVNEQGEQQPPAVALEILGTSMGLHGPAFDIPCIIPLGRSDQEEISTIGMKTYLERRSLTTIDIRGVRFISSRRGRSSLFTSFEPAGEREMLSAMSSFATTSIGDHFKGGVEYLLETMRNASPVIGTAYEIPHYSNPVPAQPASLPVEPSNYAAFALSWPVANCRSTIPTYDGFYYLGSNCPDELIQEIRRAGYLIVFNSLDSTIPGCPSFCSAVAPDLSCKWW